MTLWDAGFRSIAGIGFARLRSHDLVFEHCLPDLKTRDPRNNNSLLCDERFESARPFSRLIS